MPSSKKDSIIGSSAAGDMLERTVYKTSPIMSATPPTWSFVVNEVYSDLFSFMASRPSIIAFRVSIFAAIAAVGVSIFQRRTWTTNAYSGYLLWIIIMRLGDFYLVYYPWKLCFPKLLGTPRVRKGLCLATILVSFSECVFITAPPNKNEWQVSSKTTALFKTLVAGHYISYFTICFGTLYWYTSRALSKKNAKTLIVPMAIMTMHETKIEMNETNRSTESKKATFVACIVLLFSCAALAVPYFTAFSIFAIGPLIFLPVLFLLASDSKNPDIHCNRGYCFLLSIFQLGIHALPSFMLYTLLPKSEMSSTSTILTSLIYYAMMAGYGHQWRLIAYNATTPFDHVILLMLFQVFDVIFSNMLFIGVQKFNARYFILMFMMMGRIFVRESKVLNDIVYMLTKQDGDVLEMATLQCTRIRRARQSIFLELTSSILLPTLFLIDTISQWGIVVRSTIQFESKLFILNSALVLFSGRLFAGSLAWMYLKKQSRLLLVKLPPPPKTTMKDAPADYRTFHYDMLYPQDFQRHLNHYYEIHLPYICVCLAYGIFNAVIFTSQINDQMTRNDP